ncbi:MAG: hypothetical protein QOI03_142 [Solirubrobacteraceae bacterium]|jgi:hypothetical protein|nr:hypothetical protein [Solirubrobacteraceae bacterium]
MAAEAKRCIRCGRPAPAPESPERDAWQVDEDAYLICPGCLSGEERRWMREEAGTADEERDPGV